MSNKKLCLIIVTAILSHSLMCQNYEIEISNTLESYFRIIEVKNHSNGGCYGNFRTKNLKKIEKNFIQADSLIKLGNLEQAQILLIDNLNLFNTFPSFNNVNKCIHEAKGMLKDDIDCARKFANEEEDKKFSYLDSIHHRLDGVCFNKDTLLINGIYDLEFNKLQTEDFEWQILKIKTNTLLSVIYYDDLSYIHDIYTVEKSLFSLKETIDSLYSMNTTLDAENSTNSIATPPVAKSLPITTFQREDSKLLSCDSIQSKTEFFNYLMQNIPKENESYRQYILYWRNELYHNMIWFHRYKLRILKDEITMSDSTLVVKICRELEATIPSYPQGIKDSINTFLLEIYNKHGLVKELVDYNLRVKENEWLNNRAPYISELKNTINTEKNTAESLRNEKDFFEEEVSKFKFLLLGLLSLGVLILWVLYLEGKEKNQELQESNNTIKSLFSENLLTMGNLRIKEKELELRNEDLFKSNEQLQILKSELNHRTKNNLLLIESSISNKLRKYRDTEAYTELQDIKQLVMAFRTLNELLEYKDSNSNAINLQHYLEKLYTNIQRTGKFQKDTFNYNIKLEDLPNINFGVASQLAEILSELFTNAIKHCKDELSITSEARLVEDQLYLSIADNGPGIKGKIAPRTGLANTKEMVEKLLKGKLGLDRNYEAGTRWEIWIPVKHLLPKQESI